MLLYSSKFLEVFELFNERNIIIKKVSIDDMFCNNNFEFIHTWSRIINKFLKRDFKIEDFKEDKKKFLELLMTPEMNVIVGAFYNLKIVGILKLHIKPQKGRLKYKGSWGLRVHPLFQNIGLGTRLLELAEEIAKTKNVNKLEAKYMEENIIAGHVYLNKLNYKKKRKESGIIKIEKVIP